MGKFDDYINITAPLHAATVKGKLGNANEVFLEGDTQNIENEIKEINSRHKELNEKHDNLSSKHESLSKTVQNIAATGGASTANNVTYNNDSSRLNAENAQDAIDELENKKFDKESILQESGDAEDKVMSQKATTTAIEAAASKNEEQDQKLSELDIKVNGGETVIVVDKSSQIDKYAMLVTTLEQTTDNNTSTQVFPIEVGKMYKVNVPQSLNSNFYTIAFSDREVTTAGWSSAWLKKVPNSAGNSQPLNIDVVGEDGYPYMLISYNPIAGEPIVKTTKEISSIFATKEEFNNKIESVINDISTIDNDVSIINEILNGEEPPIPTTFNLAVTSGANEATYEQRVAFNFEANKEYKISLKNYNGSTLSSPIGIYFSISQTGTAKAQWFPNKVPAETIFSSDINLSYVWAYIRREDNSTAASFDIDIQENILPQKGIIERVDEIENEISSKVYHCTPISGFYNTIKRISDDMVDGATLLVGEGTYDLYAELGGATFANTIISGGWADWNIFTTPNLKIIGVGNVVLKMNIEHSELESISKAEEFLSAINVRQSITIENLTIDCGNCRYAIHIEGSEAEDNNNQIFNIKNCKVLRTSTSYGKNAAIGIGINKGCTLNIEDSIIDSNIGFGIGGHLNNGSVVMNLQNSVIKGGGGYQSWYMGTQWNSALSKVNFYSCYCPIINVEGNSNNNNAMFEFTFFRTPTTLTRKDNIEHCEFKAYDCEVIDNQ